MHKGRFIQLFLLAAVIAGAAPVPTGVRAEEPPVGQDEYVTKRFVILKSTRDYHEALRFVRKVASSSKIRLDLRDLSPHKTNGLSFPKKECEDNGFGFPCYIARGRYDDGVYLSIEHSSAFEGYRPGYYIVIGAGFEDGKNEIKAALKKFRKFAPDAYAKKSRVFVGCIH